MRSFQNLSRQLMLKGEASRVAAYDLCGARKAHTGNASLGTPRDPLHSREMGNSGEITFVGMKNSSVNGGE